MLSSILPIMGSSDLIKWVDLLNLLQFVNVFPKIRYMVLATVFLIGVMIRKYSEVGAFPSDMDTILLLSNPFIQLTHITFEID